MAYIQITESRFLTTADLIDGYLDFMKRKMNEADDLICGLEAFQGKDALQFRQQWNGLKEADSTYRKMAEALENYAEYLRYVNRQYEKAQSQALMRANMLPRY